MFIHLMCWLYSQLLSLYPRGFRTEFGNEMQQVFTQVIHDAAQHSTRTLLATCARELSSVLVQGVAARAQMISVTIWGENPSIFSLKTTLYRFVLLLAGLSIVGLLCINILHIFLDIIVPQTATASIERVLIGERQPDGGGDFMWLTANNLHCTVALPKAARTVDVCTTTFEGQQLQIAITYFDPQRSSIPACQATYQTETFLCSARFAYGYCGTVTIVMISDMLGVTPTRMAQLRQAEPLVYRREHEWIVGVNRLALIVAGLGLLVLWRWSQAQVTPLVRQGGSHLLLARAGQAALCLSGGIFLFGWLWYGLMFMLLSLGLAD